MISTFTVRIFFTSLLLVFLMVVLSHTNIKPTLVNPLPAIPNVLEMVKPKLENNSHNFQLKKQLIPSAYAGSDFEQAAAYLVADFDDGTILAYKNLSVRLPIASLTKIMTAVVGLDLASPEEIFSVSEGAASQVPTKVMLKSGERFKFQDLLAFMLISSANDSAAVIKEGINAKYRQDIFIQAMNYKAEFLRLRNTRFANAAGFDDPNNFSSVEDLSKLTHYALTNYPVIAELVGKSYLDLTNDADLRLYLNNWNGLLGVYPGVSGVKTGNTEESGNTTIVLSEREGKKVLVIVLGAPGVLERDLWSAELLDLGFSKLADLPPASITQTQLKQKYSSWKYF